MTKRILYKEIQKNQIWWIKLIMVVVTVVALAPLYYGLYKQLVLDMPFGKQEMSDGGLVLFVLMITVIILLADWFVFGSKLIIEIDAESIKFRYPPLIRNFRVFYRDTIERYEIRQYKPVWEYGGWGIKAKRIRPGIFNKKERKRLFSRSMAYTISGNMGLQLYLKNGKEVLLGTQRPDAIAKAMKRMFEENLNG
jgi:hypothetical protein